MAHVELPPNVSEESDDQNANIKRRVRVQLACDPCRTAKLKCDRTLPICERCFKRSREAACKYKDDGRRHIVVAQRGDTMQQKIEQLELLVQQLQGSLPTPTSASLEKRSEWLTDIQSEDVIGHKGEAFASTDSSSEALMNLLESQHILQEPVGMNPDMDHESGTSITLETSSARPGGMVHNEDLVIGASRYFTMHQLVALLPARAEMDVLVSTWCSTVETTRILVHAPTFEQQYLNFWKDPAAVAPAWLALLTAIGCLGAESLSRDSQQMSLSSHFGLLLAIAGHALQHAGTCDQQRPQYLVEALLLYVSAKLLHNNNQVTPRILRTLSHTIRLCYEDDYHHDPSTNPIFSAFDCQMRRRVWMVAQELEIMASCDRDTISTVIMSVSNTEAPSNYLDSDLAPHSQLQARPREDCTLTQVESSYFSVVSVLGAIKMCMHSMQPLSELDMDSLLRRLQDAHDCVPQRLLMTPIEQSVTDPPSDIVFRIRIELAYQRAKCLLYEYGLNKRMQWRKAQTCQDAAQSILTTSTAMLRAMTPGQRLTRHRPVLARHVYDFMAAARVLSTERQRAESIPSDLTSYAATQPNIKLQLEETCRLWLESTTLPENVQIDLIAIGETFDGTAQAHSGAAAEMCSPVFRAREQPYHGGFPRAPLSLLSSSRPSLAGKAGSALPAKPITVSEYNMQALDPVTGTSAEHESQFAEDCFF